MNVSRAFFAFFFSTIVCASEASTVHTLSDAVQKALSEHPAILAAHADEEAARYNWRGTRSGYLPSADVNGAEGFEHSLLPGQASTRHLARSERKILVQQLIFDGWATGGKIHSAAAAYFAAVEHAHVEEIVTVFSTIGAYLKVLETRKLFALAQKNVATHLKTLEQVRLIVQGGAGSKADLDLAQGRLALAEGTLTQAREDRDVAEERYRELLAESPGSLKEVGDLPSERLPSTLRQAEAWAIEHYPSLKQAAHEVAANHFNITAARGALSPRLSLEYSSSDNHNLDGTPGINRDEQLMLVFKQNVFRGGLDFATLHEQESKTYASEQRLERTRRSVAFQVNQAWIRFHASVEKLGQLRKRVEDVHKVVQAYQEQFEFNKRSLLNLLDVQRELYAARAELTQAEYEVKRSRFELLASTGTLLSNLHELPS